MAVRMSSTELINTKSKRPKLMQLCYVGKGLIYLHFDHENHLQLFTLNINERWYLLLVFFFISIGFIGYKKVPNYFATKFVHRVFRQLKLGLSRKLLSYRKLLKKLNILVLTVIFHICFSFQVIFVHKVVVGLTHFYFLYSIKVLNK